MYTGTAKELNGNLGGNMWCSGPDFPKDSSSIVFCNILYLVHCLILSQDSYTTLLSVLNNVYDNPISNVYPGPFCYFLVMVLQYF